MTIQTLAHIDDCWNRIGVWGNQTPRCPKLDQTIHCRNCEVYTAAGRLVLERELPDGYLQEWTDRYAAPREVLPNSGVRDASRSLLVFRIGGEWLAVPVGLVERIAEVREVHPLPHLQSPIMKGLVNIQGELRVCVSIAAVLGIDEIVGQTQQKAYTRMVIITRSQQSFVFPVSEVYGIHRYSSLDLQEAPATVLKAASAHTLGILDWHGKTVGCLDAERLFHVLGRSLS
ncbi:MAG: purine-binding chemotaxis protein CheW [Gemmatimonadaceae bacterium]|nr:purine-binding chemotaxis protein CheW [Gloeobacterales cyanobacterium ES-bin-141]